MRRPVLWTLMILHVAGAAGTYVLGKFAAVGFPDAASLTLARALLTAALSLPLFGWLVPWPRFQPREWLHVLAIGCLLVFGNQHQFLRGMRLATPGHPALLFAMTPALVLWMSALTERRWPTRRRILGVCMALVGVLLLLRPWDSAEDLKQIRQGDVIILGAVLSWALYTVTAAPLCRRHDPRTVTSVSLILGALVFSVFHLDDLRAVDLAAVPGDAWLGLAWLAAVTSVVMMQMWNVMLRHLAPVQVAMATNAQPPATVLLVAALSALGLYQGATDLSGWLFLGMAAVISGIVLVQAPGRRVRSVPPAR